MPKIDKWIIDKVKDAADIVDVVSDFIELHKVGVNYTGLCPFHDDHNAGNFIVRPKGLKNGGNSYVAEKVEAYKKWYAAWQAVHIDKIDKV